MEEIFNNYHRTCHTIINLILESRCQELDLLIKDVMYFMHNEEDKVFTTYKIKKTILLVVKWKGMECTLIYNKNANNIKNKVAIV